MKHCTSNSSNHHTSNNNNNLLFLKKGIHNRNVRIYWETIQRDWGVAAECFPY